MVNVVEMNRVAEKIELPFHVHTLQIKMLYSDSGDSDVEGLLLNDVVLYGLCRELSFTNPLDVSLKIERYGNFLPNFKCQLKFNSIVCNVEMTEQAFVLMLEEYFQNFLFKNKMYVKDYTLDYSYFTINFHNQVPSDLTRNRRA